MTMNSSNANGNAMAVKATLSIAAALVACFVIHKRNRNESSNQKKMSTQETKSMKPHSFPALIATLSTINSAYLRKIYQIISAVRFIRRDNVKPRFQ